MKFQPTFSIAVELRVIRYQTYDLSQDRVRPHIVGWGQKALSQAVIKTVQRPVFVVKFGKVMAKSSESILKVFLRIFY